MALTDEDVGRNVRNLRTKRKMTQAALASRMYVDRTAISRLESGHRAVTAPELAAIATILAVDVGRLVAVSGINAPVAPRVAHEPLRSSRVRIPSWRPDPPTALDAVFAGTRALRACFARDRGLMRAGRFSNALTKRVRFLSLVIVSAVAYQPSARAKWPGFF